MQTFLIISLLPVILIIQGCKKEPFNQSTYLQGKCAFNFYDEEIVDRVRKYIASQKDGNKYIVSQADRNLVFSKYTDEPIPIDSATYGDLTIFPLANTIFSESLKKSLKEHIEILTGSMVFRINYFQNQTKIKELNYSYSNSTFINTLEK